MKILQNLCLWKILSFFTVILFVINPILITGKQTSINILDTNQTRESYDLLIIAPHEFSYSLQPLIDHKNKYDVKTKLVTIEEVYDQVFWKGKDDAEKLKYFIKDAKEEWNVSYVLLAGGRKDQSKTETWWVPVRYTYINRPYEKWPEKKFLTDLYFADIYDKSGNFSSWDYDNDGVFGEWPINDSAEDMPDLYPDVFVGRLPCRNNVDVKNVVTKIINYETGTFDDSWFKRLVVVAGDTYPDKTSYYDGEVHTQKAIDIMSEYDFEYVKLWGSLGNLHWAQIVKEINKGCGFMFFSGHGNPSTWSNHPPNNKEVWIEFKLRHMLLLNNKDKLPVITASSTCYGSLFNVSLSHSIGVYLNILNKIFVSYNVPCCWPWYLVRKTNGGSIATISSTGLSYESSDIDSGLGGCEWLDILFFEEYTKSNTSILGECWANSISSFLQNFSIDWSDTSCTGDALIAKNVEQWLLIGDPSLKIGGYS